MKFTLSWLKEHLDTEASLPVLLEKLTAIGLEVESVDDPAAAFAAFASAVVLEAAPHPDADRLRVCRVDTGSGTQQVVCGAPNARAGMTGIFAPEGAWIRGTQMILKKGVIRGVESCGMLVSEREMGLSDAHEGIIELPEGTPAGVPFARVFGMDDPVIDIAVTPNRADCTGVRGIARDLAAAGLGTLKPLICMPVAGTFESPLSVALHNPAQAPLFLGRFVRGVKNGVSPAWMQNRLKAVGLRPISALVDITNYMTMGLGRPLHVYDSARLSGDLHVRLARAGETLAALNEKTYALTPDMTVICDARAPVALGGIIGGMETGCTLETTDVFIECAWFDPSSIARTGRQLQIESDARYRFERGVDPAFLPDAMEIATRLVLEICGGTASKVVTAGTPPAWSRTISFDPAHVRRLAGMDVAESGQEKILSDLGFHIARGAFASSLWQVTPPSWRGDVEGAADLVEEIIRIHGINAIPAVSLHNPRPVSARAGTRQTHLSSLARSLLAMRGMEECVTWSFMSKGLARSFRGGKADNKGEKSELPESLTLLNPVNADLDHMRPSILPNLIGAVGRNHDRGSGNAALFEIGPVFKNAGPEGQLWVASGVRHLARGARHWSAGDCARAVDVFDAKADALSVLEVCGAPTDSLQIRDDAPAYYHPGRSGTLSLGAQGLAHFGEIHPAILEEMRIKAPVAAFEVFLDRIPVPRRKSGTARAPLKLSAFQPVHRDFAFTVDSGVQAESLLRAARQAEKILITQAEVFDVYTGSGVEAGRKSVALSITIQPQQQTLTDTEIESIARRVVDSVSARTGATLRS